MTHASASLAADPLDCLLEKLTQGDQAAAEDCPVWPGQPVTAHWGLPDPAAVQGTDEDRRRAFRETLVALRRRIELLVALPIEKLGRLALQERVRAIGTT